MHNLEHVHPMWEHPENKGRVFLNFPANYFKISFNYKKIKNKNKNSDMSNSL